jgi:hypothetical protein
MELRPPKGRVLLRGIREAATWVLVPEAPVHKDDGPVLGKDDVGLAGEGADVNPESKPLPVQPGANDQFGSCVATPDAGHHSAAGGAVDDVRQYPTRREGGEPVASPAMASL